MAERRSRRRYQKWASDSSTRKIGARVGRNRIAVPPWWEVSASRRGARLPPALPSPSPRAGGRLGGGSNLAPGCQPEGSHPHPTLPPQGGRRGENQAQTTVVWGASAVAGTGRARSAPPTGASQSLPPGRGEVRWGVESLLRAQRQPRGLTPIPPFPLKGGRREENQAQTTVVWGASAVAATGRRTERAAHRRFPVPPPGQGGG